jgi:chromosome segregation ATPase
MSDEELVKRLRDMDGDSMSIKTLDEAADRIEALTYAHDTMVHLWAKEAAAKQVALGRIETLTKERDDYAFKLSDANNTYSEMHVELEALTEQLKAARADAKEAEAYAEDLERERDYTEGTNEVLRGENQRLEAKLAKAVEGLRFYAAGFWHDNYPGGVVHEVNGVAHLDYGQKAQATLAEIEGERG